MCLSVCVRISECFHASDRGGVTERGRKLKREGKRGKNERERERGRRRPTKWKYFTCRSLNWNESE